MAVYRPVPISPTTPPEVQRFFREAVDLFLGDVHAMLHLPIPGASFNQACNFAGAAVLLDLMSGASRVLFDPEENLRSGRAFLAAAEQFYPWRQEPPNGVIDPQLGSDRLYKVFRNPLAHAFGWHGKADRVFISRFQPMEPAEIEAIELSTVRPDRLNGVPTLKIDASQNEYELSVEALYWGVRQMLVNLSADATVMARAARHLSRARPTPP